MIKWIINSLRVYTREEAVGYCRFYCYYPLSANVLSFTIGDRIRIGIKQHRKQSVVSRKNYVLMESYFSEFIYLNPFVLCNKRNHEKVLTQSMLSFIAVQKQWFTNLLIVHPAPLLLRTTAQFLNIRAESCLEILPIKKFATKFNYNLHYDFSRPHVLWCSALPQLKQIKYD